MILEIYNSIHGETKNLIINLSMEKNFFLKIKNGENIWNLILLEQAREEIRNNSNYWTSLKKNIEKCSCGHCNVCNCYVNKVILKKH